MKNTLAAVFLCTLSAATLSAQVTLSDGSVVYGDILSMTDGEDLVLDTSHMDTVTIDWEAVVSLRDTRLVEVELFNGRRVMGRVAVEGGQVLVDEGEALIAERNRVFSMSEVNETFTERLDAYTDIGSNFVRGNNTVTQLTFGAGASYTTTAWDAGIGFSSIVNEQTNAQDTRRLTFNADYAYNLQYGWQAGAYYQFESDEQQGLTGRSLFGAGMTKRLINQRRHRLEVVGGLALNVEEFDGLPRNESLEAVLGAAYRLRWFLDTDLSYRIYPSLEEDDRLRTELNGDVSFDLLSDLDFKITFYDRYDSRPPLGNANNDTGLTFGLSWDF
jgi:putative salt-induced outer membrane protein YdiY